MLERHCILVGMPGVGKTTIGRRLANRLGTDFVDLDAVIETEIGCPIRTYFEHQGEAAFRDIEARLLELKPFVDGLATVEPAKRDSAAFQRLRWRLEEWRVSLFAQELGTREPVSAKRLARELGDL